MKARERGMTLLELLLVVAIIGVLAAAAIWNYIIGIDRGKQARTMSDMRSIAQAWEARATDRGGYNAAGAALVVWPASEISYTNLRNELTPTYIRPMPLNDGWNHPLAFAMDEPLGSSNKADVYAIRSSGKDGVFESSYTQAVTTDFACDIVYSNGNFLVQPQKK